MSGMVEEYAVMCCVNLTRTTFEHALQLLQIGAKPNFQCVQALRSACVGEMEAQEQAFECLLLAECERMASAPSAVINVVDDPPEAIGSRPALADCPVCVKPVNWRCRPEVVIGEVLLSSRLLRRNQIRLHRS